MVSHSVSVMKKIKIGKRTKKKNEFQVLRRRPQMSMHIEKCSCLAEVLLPALFVCLFVVVFFFNFSPVG